MRRTLRTGASRSTSTVVGGLHSEYNNKGAPVETARTFFASPPQARAQPMKLWADAATASSFNSHASCMCSARHHRQETKRTEVDHRGEGEERKNAGVAGEILPGEKRPRTPAIRLLQSSLDRLLQLLIGGGRHCSTPWGWSGSAKQRAGASIVGPLHAVTDSRKP